MNYLLDDQVILRENWLENRVRIQDPGLRFIRLTRPATEDLLLTKMMRVDPQDRQDILYLVQQLRWGHDAYLELFSKAVVPQLEGLQEAFDINREWLMKELKNENLG